MDKDHQHSKQSSRKLPHTPPHNNNNIIITNDRVKRDEWSEGAISSLLEAYEAKWTLRNRAKLKGQDWEDVARHVSARANNSKSAKTQTQCKNKIESMKKRYRSESAAAAVDAPSWPLYSRLDLLLRGNGCGSGGGGGGGGGPVVQVVANPPPVVVTDAMVSAAGMTLRPPAIPARSERQNSQGSNAKGADNNGDVKPSDEGSDKHPTDDTESSTPQLNRNPKAPMKGSKEERKCKSIAKRRKEEGYWAIGESIRWIAEAMVRSEEARMETMRDIERMRAEAEEKRGEMDLRRTEIIANTQLEIARLFAGASSTDSSMGVGRT